MALTPSSSTAVLAAGGGMAMFAGLNHLVGGGGALIGAALLAIGTAAIVGHMWLTEKYHGQLIHMAYAIGVAVGRGVIPPPPGSPQVVYGTPAVVGGSAGITRKLTEEQRSPVEGDATSTKKKENQ